MPEQEDIEGNAAQTRLIAKRIAQQMIDLYGAPPTGKAELPPTLKWAGGIIGGIMTAGSLVLAVWLISTVNTMQVTLARMDERQVLNAANLADRFERIDQRLQRLEETRKTIQ